MGLAVPMARCGAWTKCKHCHLTTKQRGGQQAIEVTLSDVTSPLRASLVEMATLELYRKGASVWIPDPDAVWVSAKLCQDYSPAKSQLRLQLSDGREVHYPVVSLSDLPPLGNPDILEGENDLTALSFLHEPAVLHNLKVRFLDYSSIYTYCGIMLVAINPYDELPIYGEEVIDAYSGQDMADMEPHIFAVAEEAYRTMTREEKNQSIIISGESGSGKTVSAKFTMRYFAVVGGAARQTSVEEKVLASNPIMESIGNAKTTRNDNSSRFGKYIEIGFGRKGDIIGASMRTYLLEKSRVVFQASAERNYHIFYQLCASRDLPEMRSLKLGPPEYFRYTSQGEEMQIPGTDDFLDFKQTRSAFSILGVENDQQMELFRILAAVLHLGNVAIRASGRSSDRSYTDADDGSLAVFSKLLGVDGPQMAHWLCHRRLTVGGEMLIKPMSSQQAAEARNALAKHIYGQLFTWTVHRLNSALRTHRDRARSFIGVLDIYGFETFEQNSFEQFCINYANEKLQQQFNRHVFQLEQEEYIQEELVWSRIEFSDNQQCISLIEGHLGLFDLLDEECRMPKGSDESWVLKLYDQHLNNKPHPHFGKPRLSNSAFVVLHFADAVQYECHSFLDKNRDTVFEELINILRASQSELVAELFQQGTLSSVSNGSVRFPKKAHREHKLSVGFQFRQSLQLLMDTLNSTTPHYVRCIKPNDLKEPFMFDPQRTVQQLRACGVLETIRISATGFPSKWTYEEFFSRYRILLGQHQTHQQVQALCRQAVPHLIPDPEQYRFGKTKVFLRAGQVAMLERLREEKLRGAAVTIQSWLRGWLARVTYQRRRCAAVTIQRYSRGALARRLAQTLRYTKVAIILQKTYRMLVVRQMFLLIRQATVTIQAFTRGSKARRKCRQLLAERAAVLLQARVRGWMARHTYRRVRAAAVFMQCCVRRRAARRELAKLKTEARSVARYRELNKGMEVKVMQLQLRLDQEARESAALRETLRTEREAREAELETLRVKIQKLESQKHVQLIPVTPEKEVEERRRPEEKAAQEILRLTQELQTLQREKDSVWEEKEDLSTRLLEKEKAQEEFVRQAVTLANAALMAELEEERRKHQGALRDLTRSEQRYDNLREMTLLSEQHFKGHRRTDSTQSLSLELPSTRMFPSPLSSAVPSPEELRRFSVTSPTAEKGAFVWKVETPMDQLMDRMDVAKDPAVKMGGEDLAHAYDAVRVANKFLEKQLRNQQHQWEEELDALQCQIIHTSTGSASAATTQQALQELLAAREHECVRLRRELKELRDTVTLRRIVTQAVPSSPLTPEGFSPSLPKQATLTGLLECRNRDESKLIKNLITDVRVDVALSLTPGLPASVAMLCVRQADCIGDQTRARSLCSTVVTAMKAALKIPPQPPKPMTRRPPERERGPSRGDHGSPSPSSRQPPSANIRAPPQPTNHPHNGLQEPTPHRPREGPGDHGRTCKGVTREANPKQLSEGEERKGEEATHTSPTRPPAQPQIRRRCQGNHRTGGGGHSWRSTGGQGGPNQHGAQGPGSHRWTGHHARRSPNQGSSKGVFLLNTDLSDLCRPLSDLCIQAYQQLIFIMETRLQNMIVPALLEGENISWLSSSGVKLGGSRKRAGSGPRTVGGDVPTMASVLRELGAVHAALSHQDLPLSLMEQTLRQLTYFISASALNSLLLRKDVCCWSRGMQIRYNVSLLEEWLRNRGVQAGGAVATLEPLIQATQLLQLGKKTKAEAQALVDTCTALSSQQITKILTLYTPHSDLDEKVTVNFIRIVQGLLKGRSTRQAPLLIMDARRVFPVTFPYTPPPVLRSDQLHLPDSLKISFLRRT
ncbi:unconventional myosin-Vb [Thalassophryne amazonica]|uniref:unconventional myosin-Vb n=1 Tax=Thalassophryne amazonica TaxID=390379 RepID=UPI001471151E|nr:unconventional myosin-Vb [Thalassophryne amazonica]